MDNSWQGRHVQNTKSVIW